MRDEVREAALAIMDAFPDDPEEIDLPYVQDEIDWLEGDTGNPAGVSAEDVYIEIRTIVRTYYED